MHPLLLLDLPTMSLVVASLALILGVLKEARDRAEKKRDRADKAEDKTDQSLDGLAEKIAQIEKDLRRELVILERELRRTIAEDNAERIGQLTEVRTTLNLFLKMIERKAVDVLHQPIHFERDKLLEAYEAETATDEQIKELARQLREMIDDKDESPGRRTMAGLLLSAMQVKYRHLLRPDPNGLCAHS